MSPEALWIGDNVRLKKSGRIGLYEGITNSKKARIRTKEKIIITPFTNIEIYTKDPPKRELQFNKANSNKKDKHTAINELDLHIQILAPTLVNQLPDVIRNKQVKACQSFIEKAILQYTHKVTIIHGIGTGQLKTEVLHLLKGYDEVKKIESVNNSGATHVTFGYY